MRSSMLLVGVLVLGAGCTNAPAAPTPPPPPPPPGPPAPLLLQRIGHGNGQVELEGQPLPGRLEVLVTRGGVPQVGIPVEWTTTSGSLSVTQATTGFTGISFARLTLGDVIGEVEITARIAAEPSVAPVVFRATARERLTATLVPGGNNQTGEVGTTLPAPLRIHVTRQGTPRAGVEVSWRTSLGTVSAPVTLTDAQGYAEATWTLGTVPSNPVAVATVPGAPQSLVFHATAIAGPPEQFEVRDPGDLPANDYETTPAVWLLDRYGNSVGNSPVEWLVLSGPASIRWADNTSGSDGWASAGIDPTGTQGNVRVRVRSLISSLQHTFSFNATAPEYFVRIVDDWESGFFGFWSTRNRTVPVVDTMPVGVTVTWQWLEATESGPLSPGYTIESVGTPGFPGGTVNFFGPHSVTFGQPGLYRYRISGTDVIGTIVIP